MFQVSRSRVFRLFPFPLWANGNKKEKFRLHIFCVPVCPYARMPVYRVLFRLKFSSVSGHIIKCLLTEFGGASAENIWLGVMEKRSRCARSVGRDPEPSVFSVWPSHSINKCTVFRLVRHTFISHDVIEHEK